MSERNLGDVLVNYPISPSSTQSTDQPHSTSLRASVVTQIKPVGYKKRQRQVRSQPQSHIRLIMGMVIRVTRSRTSVDHPGEGTRGLGPSTSSPVSNFESFRVEDLSQIPSWHF